MQLHFDDIQTRCNNIFLMWPATLKFNKISIALLRTFFPVYKPAEVHVIWGHPRQRIFCLPCAPILTVLVYPPFIYSTEYFVQLSSYFLHLCPPSLLSAVNKAYTGLQWINHSLAFALFWSLGECVLLFLYFIFFPVAFYSSSLCAQD